MRWSTLKSASRVWMWRSKKSTPPKMKAVIEGLQALRGIAQVAAVTIVAELGEIARFSRARQLMGYGGIVASEHSSGESTQRGSITKTGNAHLRLLFRQSVREFPCISERLVACGKPVLL
jgi:transposase